MFYSDDSNAIDYIKMYSEKKEKESAEALGKIATTIGSLLITNAVVDKLNKDSSDALRKGMEYAEKSQREVEQAARDFYNS